MELPASTHKPGRTVSVSLIHEHSPLNLTMTVNQNLVLPFAETGILTSHGQFHVALAITGPKDKTTVPVSELSMLDRPQLSTARTIVGGGDLIFVEDLTHLRNTRDRRQALDLLPVLAPQGSAIILATVDPATVAQAGYAILLTNGRLSAGFVRPKKEEFRQTLGDGVEDPTILLGPIPLAPARIGSGDPISVPSASLFPAEDESLTFEVNQGTHARDLAFSKVLERSETRPQETPETLEILEILETLEALETIQESKAETTPDGAAIHNVSPGDAPHHDTVSA